MRLMALMCHTGTDAEGAGNLLGELPCCCASSAPEVSQARHDDSRMQSAALRIAGKGSLTSEAHLLGDDAAVLLRERIVVVEVAQLKCKDHGSAISASNGDPVQILGGHDHGGDIPAEE